MSLFSKLFGGSSTQPEPPADTHKGFTIHPDPQPTNGGFCLAARIEKDVDGTRKIHHMLRADTIADRDEAAAYSIHKAKALIDEQGDRIFG